MVALPVFVLGAAGQALTGAALRHAVMGAYRPGPGLQAISGCLAGPPNTQGELTLGSNTQLTVQPFRAVIQNSQDLTAGGYVVASAVVQTFTPGGAAGLTMPAQDAAQFRRALIAVHVDDAQVAGSGGNAGTLEVLPGALAATSAAAALPASPANALLLGELLVPPTGQTVTLTPYNPRTSTRGGIQPVIADTSTVAGHAGAPPAYDGQARWHPTRGLEIGAAGAWAEGDTGWTALNVTNPLLPGADGLWQRITGRTCHFNVHATYGGGAWAANFPIVTFTVAPGHKRYVRSRAYGPTGTADLIVGVDGRLVVDEQFTAAGIVASGAFAVG